MFNTDDVLFLHTACRKEDGTPRDNHGSECLIRKDCIETVYTGSFSYQSKTRVGLSDSSSTVKTDLNTTVIRLKGNSMVPVLESYSQVIEMLFEDTADRFC